MASHDPSASNPFKDMDSTSSPDSSFRRGPGHDHHHNIPNNPLSGSSSSSSSPTPPPRNLVLCLDGTSNEFSSRNTNVVKLFHITACSSSFTSPQMIYFDSGVGTYLKPSQSSWSSLKKKIAIASELAFAWDFSLHIINAYTWLCDTYRDGDKIFIFGFSRGSYTARALAGMIEKVGLLPPGNHSQIPFAWKVYMQPDQVAKAGHLDEVNLDTNPAATAFEWKKTFSRSRYIDVHFVGVWDTVSSIGVVNLPDMPFVDVSGRVHYFRHALALNERRAKFQPDYFHPEKPSNAIANGTSAHANNCDAAGDKNGPIPKVKEAWFTGVHCDCGGSYELNDKPSIANIPLRWMVREAVICGLLVAPEALCESPAWNQIQNDEIRALIPPQYWSTAKDTPSRPVDKKTDWKAIIMKAADLDSEDPKSFKEPLPADLAAPFHESLTGFWNIVELLWIPNWIYKSGTYHRYIKWSQHLWAPREMIEGQKIHRSVMHRLRFFEEQGNGLAWPRAKLVGNQTWEQVVQLPPNDPIWEM